MENNGIKYTKPDVYLLNSSGLGVAEIAARTCYDSFENSENSSIYDFGTEWLEDVDQDEFDKHMILANNIESSELLKSLAWVHHHHSIIEHVTLQYLIKGTSRGVLQEHSRHRIQAISVRSTRYTMSDVINAFLVAKVKADDYTWFKEKMLTFDLFVTTDELYNTLQIIDIWDKLMHQFNIIGPEEFYKISIAKSLYDDFFKMGYENNDTAFELLSSKKKRNVGDAFKHIVNDNWKVDMVVSFNLRSLKNYFDLRDSGAAYFQIRNLAKAMKDKTPIKYLKLIDKKYKD